MSKKIIFLDLGGVLVDLEWRERMSRLLNQDIDAGDIHQLWVKSQAVLDFEEGRSDFDTFARGMQQDFGIQAGIDQIQQEFLAMLKGPKDGVIEILNQLAKQYPLALLSNTNPVHHEKMLRETTLLQPFQHLFMSYQMGVMKPKPDIFTQALQQAGVAAQEVVFFDDGQINVDAAEALGIDAHLVQSPQQVLEIMNRYTTG